MDSKLNIFAIIRLEEAERELPRGNRQDRRQWRLSRHLLLVCLWLLVLIPARGEGAELVMFEAPYCEWCEAWDEEVGLVYHKTSEGRLAPLRRISIDDPRPSDLASVAGIRYSPTFVLMQDGREVGRIVGYPGESHFWGLLQDLLDDLAPAPGAQLTGGT